MTQLQLPPPLLNTVHHMDAFALLRLLPAGSVQTIVTSPPYFGLRNYNADGQIGLEPTPAEYIGKLVRLFQECRRVLRDDGVMWINIGDSYNNSGKGGNPDDSPYKGYVGNNARENSAALSNRNCHGLPPKSLLGIPWRVAFALQDDGWILRSDIIWAKPNPMPESVTDRPTKAHEYVFLFSKQPRYYYDADAIKTPVQAHSIKRLGRAVSADHKNHDGAPGQTPHSMFRERPNVNKQDGTGDRRYAGFNERYDGPGTPLANARSVWTVPTAQTKEAHFATFPRKLIEPMILAGSRPGNVVFDPFMGSGTTALVARDLGRQYVGCDISAEYVAIATRRLAQPYTPPLFTDTEAAPQPDAVQAALW